MPFFKKITIEVYFQVVQDSVTFFFTEREAEVNNFWKIVNISTIGKFPSTDEWEENTF